MDYTEARYEAALSALRFVLQHGSEGQEMPEETELQDAAREIVIARHPSGFGDPQTTVLFLDER